jgi:hypothetical protein
MQDMRTGFAGNAKGRGRMLWLRIVALAVFGGLLILVICLLALAGSEGQQSGPSAGLYVALVVALAPVTFLAYMLARRSAISRGRALLIAGAMIPLAWVVPVSIFWLVVTVSS